MGTDSSRFEIFWNLYPGRNGRKLGKAKTYKMFQLLSEEDQLLCCRAAGAYAQQYKRPRAAKEFIPEPRDPERFLRNEWWRDWLTPETKPCTFRSVGVSCEEIAAPDGRLCPTHREYVDRLDRQRKAILGHG